MQDIKRRLRSNILRGGHYAEFRSLCDEAKDAGMTQAEIERMLFLWHPSNLFILIPLCLLLFLGIRSLF